MWMRMARRWYFMLIYFLHLLSLGQGCQSELITTVVLPLCHLIDRTITHFTAELTQVTLVFFIGSKNCGSPRFTSELCKKRLTSCTFCWVPKLWISHWITELLFLFCVVFKIRVICWEGWKKALDIRIMSLFFITYFCAFFENIWNYLGQTLRVFNH